MAKAKKQNGGADTLPDLGAAPKRGRPPALVADDKTIQQVQALAQIQCTQAEAAAVMLVAKSTFVEFLNNNPEARDAWERGPDMGKASLRRTQFEMSKRFVAMAIWLGKQYLGQKDQVSQQLELQGRVGVSDARERVESLLAGIAAAAAAERAARRPH